MSTTYKGNPQNYPTALTLFDDATPPTAANLNTVQQGELDRSAFLNAHGGLGVLLSGGLPQTTGGPFTSLGTWAGVFNDAPQAANCPSSQYFIFSGYSAGITTYFTAGDGIWTSLATTTSAANPAIDLEVSVESAGAPGTVWLSGTDGSHILLWKLAPAGASFTVVSSALTITTGCTDVQLAQAPASSASAVYVAVGATSGANAELGNANDAGGVNFTLTGLTATKWLLASNGTYGLAIPKQAGASLNAYKSNAAGSTWTPGVIGLAATDVPIALTWSKIRSLWFLAVNSTGTGAVNTTWSSPDGVVWTNTGTTITGHAGTFADMVAIGPHLIACDSDGAATPTIRLYVSSDGGLTWYPTSYRVIGSESTDTGRLIAAPGGGLVLQARKAQSGSTTNSAIRFSMAYGLGDQQLT